MMKPVIFFSSCCVKCLDTRRKVINMNTENDEKGFTIVWKEVNTALNVL